MAKYEEIFDNVACGLMPCPQCLREASVCEPGLASIRVRLAASSIETLDLPDFFDNQLRLPL